MIWNRNERLGFAVVIGLSLAAAFWFQTSRTVRIGMPGAMPRTQYVAASQAEPESETRLTHLSPSRLP